MSEYASNSFRRIDQISCHQQRAKRIHLSSILSGDWLPTPVQKIGDRRFQDLGSSSEISAIAGHASVLVSQDKQILICSLNITLINYFRDPIDRHVTNLKIIRKQVKDRNFYNWCERIYENADYAYNSKQFWRQFLQDAVLDHHMVELILWIYKDSSVRDSLPTYNVILIDKGPDYMSIGWDPMREAVIPGGEKLLVGDKT